MYNEKFMKRALKIAFKGTGKVNPNPLVGAVITDGSKIISEGYHKVYGDKHAEVNAVEEAEKRGISVKGKDIYVTLEPCSHFGKTPPCADMIIKKGFKNVYIGIKDPNPAVNGRGIKKIIDSGINTEYGFYEDEIKIQNKFFIKNMKLKKPYITLKTAITLDGFIADRKENSKWISNERSRNYVHINRYKHMSVMAGSRTVIKDNPELNVRFSGKTVKSPIRIILDKDNLIKNNKYKIFNENGKNILITPVKVFDSENTDFIITEDFTSENIIKEISLRNIDSVFIEGGAGIYESFFDCTDYFMIFTAPKIFSSGKKAFEFADNRIFDIKEINVFDDNVCWEAEKCLPE
ncbi:MAG: bifunctional diaminohydroxyphosphoribosylaminopyrimidine deaminase/5-amino-6-(5-phosphoribosylamino)uracil reductase RibD [Thermotogae bacterium]|nr:bifunctional diaminohydroxyphosphoribosylaminopyrimidine deaminase/5-amino-6-(5-phosphoribosylamino)uracil reductase RibD [Thermotogota bacterium]